MNFSELYTCSSSLCSYSPNGYYLGRCSGNRLFVQGSDALQLLHVFSNEQVVTEVEWSPDSMLIVCAQKKAGIVQIWSLNDPGSWKCKIDTGCVGLEKTLWAPDSRSVLLISKFYLRLDIWCLWNKSVVHIDHPKKPRSSDDDWSKHNVVGVSTISFTADGKYLAIARREKCKDIVSIYQCQSWEYVKSFQADTINLAGLNWAPDASTLCVWDCNLAYKCLLYSPSGALLRSFSPEDPSVQCHLGIRCVQWSPDSKLLAIGGYDQKVRLLNHLTWQEIVGWTHSKTMAEKTRTCAVYQERPLNLESIVHDDFRDTATDTAYAVVSSFEIQNTKPDPSKPNPKIGVVMMAFGSQHLATLNENMPHAIWVWNLATLSLKAVLLQLEPVRCCTWDPHPSETRLALCTGTDKIYFWTPQGCISVRVPNQASSSLSIGQVSWHPAGGTLLFSSRDTVLISGVSMAGVSLGGFTFSEFFKKGKTFRPKKKFVPGTLKYSLHKQAQASLNAGKNLRYAVRLPPGEDLNDWIAVHVVDFFNRINLIYGTVCDYCLVESCPIMSGGQKFEYLWCDGVKFKKPVRLPAPKYISFLMDWIEDQINNEELFPVRVDVPFPKSFGSLSRKILTRLFRVFVHVYIHHFDRIISIGAEPHVNTCYKHFYYFITEFDLVSAKELEPLKDMTARICNDPVPPPDEMISYEEINLALGLPHDFGLNHQKLQATASAAARSRSPHMAAASTRSPQHVSSR
ncbi:unnamed protein product, partial [Cyprideis torosa]